MSTDTVNGNGVTDDESKWIDSEKLAKIEGKQLEQLKQSFSENSKWIDRDKLEQIEVRELEQAGIRLPPKTTRASPSTVLQIPHQPDGGILTRNRTNSDSSGDESKYYNPNEPDNDLRLPAERAADTQRHPMRHAARNGSSSRIPLSTTSPVPVPQQYIERAAPLVWPAPSPENGSDDDNSSYKRSRKRSYSAGSAVLLTENSPPSGPAGAKPPATPRTNRVQSHTATPKRTNSKSTRLSSNSTLSKNKHKSNPQLAPNLRPTSSHQAPEGPPPWSLSTYSPDPKLPPDQQIIPTVAKRLQQEQWEKEGVFATVYDGKLRPLKVENLEHTKKKKETKDEEAKEDSEQVIVVTGTDNEWPLAKPKLSLPPITGTPPPKEEDVKTSKPVRISCTFYSACLSHC